MKKIFVCTCLLFSLSQMNAQNDPLYSQYIFNKLLINPAYAGSRNIISTTLLYRNQWVDIDGAPETYTFSIHSPMKNEHYALGMTVFNDRIAAFNNTGFLGIFAYRMRIKNSWLALGVQGGASYFHTRRAEFAEAVSLGDPAVFAIESYEWIPNVGGGVYFNNRFLSLGFSVPQILSNDIYKKTKSVQNRHYYFTADYLVRIIDNFRLKPSVLFKFGENIRAQFDANLNLIVMNAFSVGAGYRTDNSYVFSGQVFLNKIVETKKVQLAIGYAYDLSNKDYREEAHGVHEAMLMMEFLTKNRQVVSPRYF